MCRKNNTYFPKENLLKTVDFTPKEWETEKLVAKAFKRPYRHFFHDMPTYPYVVPEPIVNFALKFTE